jgi:DNA-binding transcriptional regulator YiaG
MPKIIINRIHPLLCALGMTGARAAAYLDVSEQTISKWRVGRVQAPHMAVLALERLLEAKELLNKAGVKS